MDDFANKPHVPGVVALPARVVPFMGEIVGQLPLIGHTTKQDGMKTGTHFCQNAYGRKCMISELPGLLLGGFIRRGGMGVVSSQSPIQIVCRCETHKAVMRLGCGSGQTGPGVVRPTT